MDPIWKDLSKNQSSCRKLRLYCQSDPASRALFVINCDRMLGITYEENFENDVAYLIESVLPDNRTLDVVEVEWSFLSRLEENDRWKLMRAVTSESLEEFTIRGFSDDDSSVKLTYLTVLLRKARNLKHLSVEVSQLIVEDRSDLLFFAATLEKNTNLESIHLHSLKCENGMINGFYDPLMKVLFRLPQLKTLHLSCRRGEETTSGQDDEDNEENETNSGDDRRAEESYEAVSVSALKYLSKSRGLSSLTLIQMGLHDGHCRVFETSLENNFTMHTLLLLDNPSISENGQLSLLRLLQKNRSLYNTLFGPDIQSPYREDQLKLLHMNRCGREKMRTGKGLNHLNWAEYLSHINQTVPEEIEVDAIYTALKENPDMVKFHQSERPTKKQDSSGVRSKLIHVDSLRQSDTLSSQEQSLRFRLEELVAKEKEMAARERELHEREKRVRRRETSCKTELCPLMPK